MPTSSNQPEITEKLIRRLASGESFQRGREYFQSGAVTNLPRRGDRLLADVEGSSYEPYRVDITFDAGGIASSECTCPYDWGGACKHIVAVLLAYINEPEQVEERPPLDTLLTDLSSEQFRSILSSLAEQQPGLTDVIEAQVLALQTRAMAEQARTQSGPHSASKDASGSKSSRLPQQPQQPQQRQTVLDPATFKRQVHSILHSLDRMRMSEAYWHVGSIVQSVRQVAEQAVPFIEAGDGRSALAILQGVTEAYIADWTNLDDSDGELGAYFEDLGALWTEAILTADLTPAERKTWAKRFSKWQGEVDEYGIDAAFQPAETAAEQGWDYPPLLRILRGEVVEEVEEDEKAEDGADEDEEDDYDWRDEEDESNYTDTLTLARLNVLERQGRTQEYLNLARAEGEVERYVNMLVKLGRLDEATSYALTRLHTANDVLSMAQALRGKGAIEQALNVARHGLSLEGRPYSGGRLGLAHWLRDLAESVGRRELALEAALVAIREVPSLDDYQDVQSLAGKRWPELREELLKMLRGKPSPTRAQVEIYLYEGLVDDAIAAVSDGYVSHELVDMVVDGALKARSHHEWVIEACRRQADAIIDGGKSQLYGAAARWLEKARIASVAARQEDEWRTYVQEIIARHKRKYSLLPLLEALLKRR